MHVCGVPEVQTDLVSPCKLSVYDAQNKCGSSNQYVKKPCIIDASPAVSSTTVLPGFKRQSDNKFPHIKPPKG